MPNRNRMLPPNNYHLKSLDCVIIPKNTPLFRCYDSDRDLEQAVFFGKTKENRFDDIIAQNGVLYLGTTLWACLVETLLHNNAKAKSLGKSFLEKKSLAILQFKKDLTLVNYNGVGLVRNDVEGFIFTCEHNISQLWASSIMNNENHYSGIYFPCNHNNECYSVALFESADVNYSIEGIGTLYGSLLKDDLDKFCYAHRIMIT